MIARIWHGTVPVEKSEEYHRYLQKTGLRDYKLTPGNKATFLLKKMDGKLVHFITLTFWQDFTAIKKFAGNDLEKARYYSEDEYYLTEKESFVSHYEILESQMENIGESISDSLMIKTFFQRPFLYYR